MSRILLPPAACGRARGFASACLAALVALAGGCGDAPPPAPAPPPALPQWRTAREEGPADHGRLALRCEGPCRTRFRIESEPGGTHTGPWRTLKTGQTIRIWWVATAEPAAPDLVDPADAAAGLTDVYDVRLEIQYSDGPVDRQPYLVGTRPGRGQALVWHALPPGAFEPLPDTDPRPGHTAVELATVAVLDLDAAGPAVLRPRPDGNRIVWPPGERGAQDREQVMRCFLDVAPVE